MRRLLPILASILLPFLLVASETSRAISYEWRDMLRTYEMLREEHADCLKSFPGFDPEMARLGESFAKTAYPENPDLGRKNFRRLALKLSLSHPGSSDRERIFVPNKEPWPGYKGEVDSGGLVHFLFNTGTLPKPLLSHPVAGVVRRHDIEYGRVKPVAQCAARVLRREQADIAVVEHDPASRTALVAKIRKTFDAENPGSPMSDEEARCLAECLPFMA